MLTELRIRNFALIDRLAVQLGPGLNVLTGETGAGKSIIVGALSLLLGERASADAVRDGAERASVEGVFDISGRADLERVLDERGVDVEDGLLILKREVTAAGRSRAWISGSPTTATALGELGRMLVDLHGQHEHQTLLRGDEQRAVLDAYAGNADLAAQVAAAHRAVQEVQREIDLLEARRRDAAQRADFLRFQVDEIEAAQLSPGEQEALEEAARRLSHAEELMALSAGLAATASGDEDSVVSRVGAMRRALDQLVRIDPSQGPAQELYDTAFYALEEFGTQMSDYAASIEHDPARLEEVRHRQDLLFRLCSKYGPTVEDVLAVGTAASAELDLLDGAGWELSGLRKRRDAAGEEFTRLTEELSDARRQSSITLAREVEEVLPELGMAGGRFDVMLLPLAAPAQHGAEGVELRVALNRGFEPRPLAQVASGGELSRVMLAIKTILARLDAVPTLIFDEVDAGIGGRVALQVGEKMRGIADSHQVFAITHLPQIASRAHTHLHVEKGEMDGRVATQVRRLDGDARVLEIARMLGGDSESRVSLDHARELLERGAAASDVA
ncbi:MAG: DNA repair protein RecN [Gemmatimonadetes bacterium]|nr:DNA repair protein RecN [Gemmatimonadota bacterium]